MTGVFGKILLVDLTSGKISDKKIDPEIFRDYIGGKGLGTYLLLKMLKPGTDPLSPLNKLIFTTGPATGSVLAPAGRYGVFSKSPLTGIYAESYSGGHTAPAMKRTGFDAVVFSGAAQKPCFIHISPGGVIFYDAVDIWGRETYDAEDAMLQAVGAKGAQALVIGPAGERQLPFACIKNNRWRSAGRGGMGAVMGSKNLKGIVFSGDLKAPPAEERALLEWSRSFYQRYKDGPEAKLYRSKGTPSLVALTNNAGCFPTRYWSRGRLDKWEQISADYMQTEMEIKPRSCYRCFFACGKLSKVLKGEHKGLIAEGPEYETIYAFGGLCCLTGMEDILYLNDLCDRWGIDTITAGNMAAFAIEAGLMGHLKEAPHYGDAGSIASFLHSVVEKRGEGAIFSRGLREAAEALGMDSFAVHVKGMEPAGYDPRVLKGMGLAYATSDRGACHLRTTFYKPELSGAVDPAQIEGKVRLFVDYEDRLNIFDCLIFCRFYRDLIQWKELVELTGLITGIDYSQDELRRVAARIQSATRLFNLREGITRADDTLPPRLMQEPINDGRDLITREELEEMLSEYYLLRGWDEKGVPLGKQTF